MSQPKLEDFAEMAKERKTKEALDENKNAAENMLNMINRIKKENGDQKTGSFLFGITPRE